jgi:hypothetical protein
VQQSSGTGYAAVSSSTDLLPPGAYRGEGTRTGRELRLCGVGSVGSKVPIFRIIMADCPPSIHSAHTPLLALPPSLSGVPCERQG